MARSAILVIDSRARDEFVAEEGTATLDAGSSMLTYNLEVIAVLGQGSEVRKSG